jgi:uncharacterized protein (TIGR01777 family)
MAAAFSGAGADVTVLARSSKNAIGPWTCVHWDGRSVADWIRVLNGADAVVNLAGRTVNCIKTPDHQDEILRSRIESTRVLGKAMRLVETPPPVWIQMSTAHIYGDPPSLICNEESEAGIGFAPTIGLAWERAFHKSILDERDGTRQRGVVFRTSFVVGRDRGAGGGALSTLSLLARLGLGGRVGKGTQGMSWIHEADLNRLFARAIADQTMSGMYIASAPNPVSQAEFMRTLRLVMKMPFGLPAFEWMVRIGAPLFLRTDPELALYGRFVVSKRLEEERFEFEYPQLETALRNLYAREH